MKKPSLKSALVAFFGSRTAVGEGSLKAWGAQQRPPIGASTAEALADELVAEGVASVEERSGGRRVWRLVREEPTPEPEPVPEEEPVAVAGAGAELLTLSDAIAHADEKGAGEGGCAADHRRLAGWLRQLEESEKARAELVRERDALRAELGAGLGDALQRTADLARQLATRTEERDEALRERDDLRRQLEAPPAALDQGAIAHYLLSLPGDRWASLATARQQLAQAREMAHAAQLLEASALAAVDGLLSAPAGAPVPAPAPQPQAPAEPAPQAKRGPRTEDGEPAPGTARAKILAWIRQQPDATARVMNVAEHFDEQAADMSAVLIGMTRAGYLERVSTGFYRAVKP